MQADRRFKGLSRAFWANVRTISERGGYVERRSKRKPEGKLKVYSARDMANVLGGLGLSAEHVYDLDTGQPTVLGTKLEAYFDY